MKTALLTLDDIDLADGTTFSPRDLTVLVGPNNGGKSRFLSDIAGIITGTAQPVSMKKVSPKPRQDWVDVVDELTGTAELDQNSYYILDSLGIELDGPVQNRQPSFMRSEWIPADGAHTPHNEAAILRALGIRIITHLKADNRLRLANSTVNVQEHMLGPQSVVHAAHGAPKHVRNWLSSKVEEAFGYGLEVDDSGFARLQFCLNDGQPVPTDYEKRRAALKTLRRVDDQGDGIRAFVGLLAAVKTTDRPIVLIDEPEAFLHPPQAFLLGRAIAEMTGQGHQIFVATHSADILRGILSKTADIQVLRMARRSAAFTARMLDAQTLRTITNDPVLSSSRVLDGLFYESVVIAESDGDVVLYRRIMDDLDASGGVHFINSYAKQNSQKLAAPFRAMDIPCALIVDFDALRVSAELSAMAKGMGVSTKALMGHYTIFIREVEGSDDALARLSKVQGEIAGMLESVVKSGTQAQAAESLIGLRRSASRLRENASIWSDLKKQGRGKLSSIALDRFKKIDAILRRKGIFVVPVGEREAWLEDVPYSKNKSGWTIDALSYLGNNTLPKRAPLRIFMKSVWKHLS